MGRNIMTLHNFELPATHEEVHASALQFVRQRGSACFRAARVPS